MIILPKDSVIVKRDETPLQTQGGIILTPQASNTGEIIFTAPELTKYQGCKVVFREGFGESLIVPPVGEVLFFRNLENSIYYIIDDKR